MGSRIDVVLDTELLAIGGSGAGIMAAVCGAEAGADVLLVSKGLAGRSGNVIMAGGGCGIDGESGRWKLGITNADIRFTKEQLFDCMVKESFYLAEQDVLQQYIDDAPTALRSYLSWADQTNCRLLFSPPCNWQASGIHFAKPLRNALKKHPSIKILEDTAIVELLHAENRITGAIGIHLYRGEIIQINAKAVVIATGGFQPCSLKNTVSDMTGDGQAMACRAGAVLSDMEFLLSFPTALVPEDMQGSIYPYLLRQIPHRILDKNGVEIPIDPIAQKLSQSSKLTKLINCFYMGHAAAKGRAGPHGGVFWDYSITSLADRRKALDQFYQKFSLWHRYGYYKGESMKRIDQMIMAGTPLEVGLGIEYSMGGIVVNSNMETAVEGLFAAGEASTGTFGACRVGDGLIEMLCQGMKAGQSAAAYCRAHSRSLPNCSKQAEHIADMLLRYFNNSGGMSAVAFQRSIETTCDLGLGVIRSEKNLSHTLRTLMVLRQKASHITLSSKSRRYNYEWLQAIQSRNLLLCCEAAAKAALARKESRGCHIRSDYPRVDHDHFLHHYDFHYCDGILEMSTRTPMAAKVPLPSGQKEDIIQYFTDPDLHYSRNV